MARIARRVGILVALDYADITDPVLQVPLSTASAALPVLVLTRYGLLAGATAMFIDSMSGHIIASLDLSQFFGGTMVAGVLLFAAPAGSR